MKSSEIREKFIEFFVFKGHTAVPSSSLIPDDPSVLLTTAGMQQFKPYYAELDAVTTVHPSLGKPIGKNACSVQKSFRTSDIDEVGDERHLTFFEMLGNFSFGGYGKKEAIGLAHEFITKVMGLDISYVTVFGGSDVMPKDSGSIGIWKKLGVTDIREEGMDDVFWGPTGSNGPCGPTTEIYCTTAAGQDVEIWNIVFNEFHCDGPRDELLAGNATLTKLVRAGVDTGMGLERLCMIAQKKKNIFETDLFEFMGPLGPIGPMETRSGRIVVDHLRASAFLLADGVLPSNKDRGYILRRIIRRLVVHGNRLGIPATDVSGKYLPAIIDSYGAWYPELAANRDAIIDGFTDERKKFEATLKTGLAEFNRRFPRSSVAGTETIDETKIGSAAFDLYQSYGFPPDVLKDLLREQGHVFDEKNFDRMVTSALAKHREVSKAGVTGKFGGHGLILSGELKASNEEEVKRVTRMHTATHMLHQALRMVLGDHVQQMGSDITPERLRFDFTHPKKVTPAEIAEIERIVNENVVKDHTVSWREESFVEAKKEGALAFFKEKYPERVKVYSVGDFSKEVCGGPHVNHTAEIGRFKIVKEEAVSAGVRRIRAVVDP